MKINRKISAKAVFGQLSVCILMLIGLIACNYNKKLDLEITPTLNITSYLEENKSTFSELLKLMDREITISGGKTIKYSSFLAAYGSYTLFAPTNEALLSYVHAKKGSDATVDNLTNDEVETLLNFHILQDTISTTSFTDGKLSVPTMTGYYLITGAQNDGGVTHIRVNKQANVVTKNIKLGNGILHVIDGVLEPPQTSTASQIENDPRFSIFTQALKETGYYDTLNIMFNPQISSAARWYSVMATPDLAYIAEGINDYAALKAKYCNTNDPTNPADSLHLYVGYHIMPGLKFVADLVAGNSYNTLTNNQVVSISKDLDSVLINEFTINGVLEKGASVLRDSSDKTTTDGVWHMMGDDYIIKVRKAQPVFLDVCDYPGFRSIPPTWGLPNTITTNINSGQIPGITWAPASTQIAYITDNTVPSGTRPYINYNHLQLYLRPSIALNWIKFTTPFIAAGKYKVWLCFAENGSTYTENIQATVATSATDSVDLPIVVNTCLYLPGRGTATGTGLPYVSLEEWDNTLQGIGYKRPMQIKGQRSFTNKNIVGQYIGAVTFTTSSTHWIKINAIYSSRAVNVWLDMIQFIPFDQDQVWPKFDQDGTAWPRPASPYDDQVSAIY